MAEQKPKDDKEGGLERTSRFFRNINALGAIALAGAAVVLPAPVAAPAAALAALNTAQAAGFEVARRHYTKKRRRAKKTK